jgi:scyllo-inosamine-4-phosphate amidinotransferase 1
MKISTSNEWGKLRSIVVGSATHANWPSNDPVFSQEHLKTAWHETPVPSGPVPQWIVDESNEDLDELANVLTKLGIEVFRPNAMNFIERGGMYNYCPRDRLLIADSCVVDPAMMYPCRDQEIDALDFVLGSASAVMPMPRGRGMVMDAANVCRLGKTWLYLLSDSGNQQALDWLRKKLPHINIEACNFYNGVHIDSTIVPLREGFVVLNASRVTPDNCPKAFDGWTKLWVTDVEAQSFHEYPYASKWIGLNMLSIDPNTVIVDRAQYRLIEDLERAGFTTIPLQLRHSRTLGGGFHCVTLDLVRD